MQAPYVPYARLAGDARPLTDTARKHLADAIASYETALSLEPRNTVARLGLGWCQMTMGQNARAIESFRTVVADAWKSEQGIEAITDLRGSMTLEVASYLVPLLHPERDAAEIATLRGYQARMAKKQPRHPAAASWRRRRRSRRSLRERVLRCRWPGNRRSL